MQTPLAGTSPNMVAVGELKIPGTNAAVRTAVPQARVPVYFVPGTLGPRDATGAFEAIGEPTINNVQATQEERRVSGSKGWCDLG